MKRVKSDTHFTDSRTGVNTSESPLHTMFQRGKVAVCVLNLILYT